MTKFLIFFVSCALASFVAPYSAHLILMPLTVILGVMFNDLGIPIINAQYIIGFIGYLLFGIPLWISFYRFISSKWGVNKEVISNQPPDVENERAIPLEQSSAQKPE